MKRLEFRTSVPTSFDLHNVKPRVYTALFPNFGGEQLTVTGGNTFGAIRAYDDHAGFNPYRPVGLEFGAVYKAPFVVPAGRNSLKVELFRGEVALNFMDGSVIVPQLKGSVAVKKETPEFSIPVSSEPRLAYVQWKEEYPGAEGLVIEGVTLFSPDPDYALYGDL